MRIAVIQGTGTPFGVQALSRDRCVYSSRGSNQTLSVSVPFIEEVARRIESANVESPLHKAMEYLCQLQVNERIRNEYYNNNGQAASLDRMLNSNTPVACRELAILGHGILLYLGIPNSVILGTAGGVRHAWIKLYVTDNNGAELPLDPIYLDPTSGIIFENCRSRGYSITEEIRIFESRARLICAISPSYYLSLTHNNQRYLNLRNQNIVQNPSEKCVIS